MYKLAHIAFFMWLGLYFIMYLDKFPFDPRFWIIVLGFEVVYWCLDAIIEELKKINSK